MAFILQYLKAGWQRTAERVLREKTMTTMAADPLGEAKIHKEKGAIYPSLANYLTLINN